MDSSSQIFLLACVAVYSVPDAHLRTQCHRPSISPLPAGGYPVFPPEPVHVFTGADPRALLAAGLAMAERPPHGGGLSLAIHVAASARSVTIEASAREGIQIALAASQPSFLVSAAAAGILHDLLPDGFLLQSLGRHRRRDLTPPEELHLLRTASDLQPSLSLATLPHPHLSLPVAHTPFLGRQKEMSALAAAIADHQLTTVTGPCGVGKSRLAAQTVAAMCDRFPHGTHYLDLGFVSPTTDLHGSLCRAAGLPADIPVAGAPTGDCLLLLDNAEHVSAPLSGIVRDLMASNPNVRIVCTSQIPLGLQSEYRYHLSPLNLSLADGAGHSDTAQLLLSLAAVTSTDLQSSDLPLVESLCQNLGGLPLAIELASELAQLVPLAHIEQRIRSDH